MSESEHFLSVAVTPDTRIHGHDFMLADRELIANRIMERIRSKGHPPKDIRPSFLGLSKNKVPVIASFEGLDESAMLGLQTDLQADLQRLFPSSEISVTREKDD